MSVALGHPLALIGLIAAITPIVIYLLLRRRKTEVNWGASYLLRLTLLSRKKSSRWKQFVVLTVRCLILALAATLLAQPFLHNRASSSAFRAPAMPDRPVHRVLLADNSTSMTVADGAAGITRAARQRQVVESLLRTQRPGDVAAILPLVGENIAPRILQGAISTADISHVVAALAPRNGSVSLQSALATALSQLASTPRSAGEIYLLSDFPRELTEELSQLGWFSAALRGRDIKIIPVSMTAGDTASLKNVAIENLTLGSDLAVAGLPMTLYIDAVNHSDEAATATFNIGIDDAPHQTQTASFAGNERKRVTSLIAPARAAPSAILKVTVDPSPLSSQASRYLSIAIKPSLEVWLVADDRDPSSADGELSESEFILRALRHRADESGKINITPMKSIDLAAPIAESVDVILIDGPRAIPPAALQPLADFARRGGGIVFAASPSNGAQGFANATDLLPATIAGPAREKLDPEIFATVRAEIPAGASRLFEELLNKQGGDLAEARFYNWLRVTDSQIASADRVILRLSSGDPLLLHKTFGRGNIYLFTSSLGVGWNSLPVRQSYVPLLARLLHAAAAGRVLPRNVAPGQSVVMPWATDRSPALIDAEGAEHLASLAAGPTTRFAVADHLAEPGLYQFKAADNATSESFTVTGPLPESDLRPLAPIDQQHLSEQLGQRIYPDWNVAIDAIGAAGTTRPLWPWIAMAMLGLYLFEVWFVRLL